MERTRLAHMGKRDEFKAFNPTPGVWMIPSFGNTGVLETSVGLVLIDVSLPIRMGKTMSMLRSVLDAPINTVFFTHGHVDHAVALEQIYNEAENKGHPYPRTVAQRNVVRRFNRYRMLEDYHSLINRIQFAAAPGLANFPLPKRNPDVTFDKSISMQIGGILVEAYHSRGETDDHLWVWVPEKKTVFTGDMIVSGFPNVGNPFKVQRFTLEWAEGLEAIAGKEPELLVPGHGDIVEGKDAVQEICLTTAKALRYLHEEVVKRLNDGMWYEDILHDVKFPDWLTEPAYLKPVYGRPEFVLHGILREYTGWYDGNPSNLFPPKRVEVNKELVALMGKDKLAAHARLLQQEEKEDVALQFVDMALSAELSPDEEKDLRKLKADLLKAVGEKDPSLISRNIYFNGYKSEMKLAGLEDEIE